MDQELVPFRFNQLIAYFLKLGTFGFGGPIALVGYMQRDLVEERRWISRQDYVDGLALAQLAPGPLAAQLAMYLGWIRGGIAGATLIAVAFILPSFLMVLFLSLLYIKFGGLTWMQGVFYGISAAIIAIIARSAVKLTKMTLAKDRLLWILFAISAVVTAWTESEIVWLFLLSGFAALFIKALPKFRENTSTFGLWFWPAGLMAGLHGVASASTLWKIAWYFVEAGSVVFGSGLAIVPFLYGGVVTDFHWLNERQFLDAIAVAMITPGPVVITVAFIGYLVAGLAGAIVAAGATFLPAYLVVILLAPYFKKLSGNEKLNAFIKGVTAAATGVIAGSAFVLGKRAIVDIPALLIFLATLLLLVKLKKIPEPILILASGVIGLVLKQVVHS